MDEGECSLETPFQGLMTSHNRLISACLMLALSIVGSGAPDAQVLDSMVVIPQFEVLAIDFTSDSHTVLTRDRDSVRYPMSPPGLHGIDCDSVIARRLHRVRGSRISDSLGVSGLLADCIVANRERYIGVERGHILSMFGTPAEAWSSEIAYQIEENENDNSQPFHSEDAPLLVFHLNTEGRVTGVMYRVY